MPEYTFQIVVILRRDNDEISLVRETHSLYVHLVLELAYAFAKPYLDEGYQLHKFYSQNYVFLKQGV